MYTVVETHYYLSKAEKLLTEEQREQVVNMLANDPNAGDVMVGCGGIRKLRFAVHQSRGKSGGARVIYLAITKIGTVYLLDIFAKNTKENLSAAERSEIAKWAKQLKGE